MRRHPVLSALLLPVLVAGCGATRTPVPDLEFPAAPRGSLVRAYPSEGVSFSGPANWVAAPGTSPAVATLTSGDALVTIWRFPRTEPLPATDRALRAALPRLEQIVRSRDPRITFTTTRTTRVGGAPAIVLTGRESIAGVERGVRSVHVYAHGGEVVLDAIAPVASFPRIDRTVFRAVAASLRVRAPRA